MYCCLVIKEGKQRLLDISLAVEKTHFIFTNLYGHCQERSISQKINNVGLIKKLAGNLNSFMLSEYHVSMFVFIIMEPMKNLLICSVIPGKHDIILIQMATATPCYNGKREDNKHNVIQVY